MSAKTRPGTVSLQRFKPAQLRIKQRPVFRKYPATDGVGKFAHTRPRRINLRLCGLLGNFLIATNSLEHIGCLVNLCTVIGRLRRDYLIKNQKGIFKKEDSRRKKMSGRALSGFCDFIIALISLWKIWFKNLQSKCFNLEESAALRL